MKFSIEFSTKELNEAQLVLQHAVQFIAASGKYLLPKKEDDSHTNMEWDSNKESFFGGLISNRAKVGLHIPSLSLKVYGPSNIELAALEMIGKSKKEVLLWLKQALQLKQVESDGLSLDMHYDIPEHETDSDKSFPKINAELLKELANHRTIADKFCKQIASGNDHASNVRTWPHHFDHGVYVPFELDSDGNAVRSFSVGYAVADGVINEPYFYVTQWKKDGKVDYSDAPILEYGEWLPEKLKGAALSLSDILKMKDQEQGIQIFLDKTLGFSKA